MKIKINIKKDVFNDKYFPYLKNIDRYLLFYGGGSSGKSYFIVQRYIVKCLSQKMNLLVTRKTGNTNRTSTFALFKQIIKEWNLSSLFDISESTMKIKCKNRNEIAFSGLDDTEKLKSVTFENGELTDIWVEEATECDESDINQLKVRMRGGKSKKQMVLSFNPIDINHWIKKHFIDSKLATVCFSTYKDNKFLSEEDKQALEDFKFTDEYYYNVYALGHWGILGKTYFDSGKINKRLREINDPLKTGYFDYTCKNNEIKNIKWINDKNGYIKIYDLPRPGHPYVLGGDTAEDGEDYFTGQALDNSNGKQVAVLKQQFDEDEYARQMYCLGMYYNETLIGTEINFSTYPTKKLQEYKYPNLYVREVEDSISQNVIDKFGFKTTKITRPIILSILKEVFRDNAEWINDKETLEEALTFVRNEKGRPEARNGAHDDLIMGLAIAYYIRTQQQYIIEKTEESKDNELPFELQTDEEITDEFVGW